MKALLEFNLNDADDITAHKRCVKSLDMAIAVSDILNLFRNKLKYSELEEKEYEAIEKLRDEVVEILADNNVNIDELLN